MDFLRQLAAPFFTLHRSFKRNIRIAAVLAAVAAAVTVYALILPASTMDRHDSAAAPSSRITAAQRERLLRDQTIRSADKGGAEQTGSPEKNSPAAPSPKASSKRISGQHTGTHIKDHSGTAAHHPASETPDRTQSDREADSAKNTDHNTAPETGTDTGTSISERTSKEGSTQKHVSLSGDVILSAKGDGYKVTVYFGKFAEIPEGSTLSVRKLSAGSSEYKKAQDAILREKRKGNQAFDGAGLGITALDITVRDVEGKEVEPKGKVGVAIEMDDMADAADLSKNADTGSIQVAHIKDGSAEALADTADKTDGSFDIAEDGSAVVRFNTDSFSTYAISYELMKKGGDDSGGTTTDKGTATVTVGDSTTLSGSGSYYHSWSSSDISIATVSGSDSSGTVKGVKAGTVTITHTYNTKSNGKGATNTETWTVTVKAASTVSDADATAQEGTDTDSGLTVSVKDKGNAKKISGYHVVVGTADGNYSSDKTVLASYKIYLADSDNKEVSSSDLMNGTLNLKVTLTYNELPDWFDKAKTVKHYKSGKEQSISGVQIEEGSKSISFIVHGFSDFTVNSTDDQTTTANYSVKVGETVSITPTGLENGNKGNTYSWSSSDASVATVTDGSSSTTVTGVKEGTVTITLKHGYKQKQKDDYSYESKIYTVTVTDESAVNKSYTPTDGAPTVTVRGNKKALNGYGVRIATTDSSTYLSTYLSDMNSANASSETLSSADDFDFLQFYRIYLVDSDGNEVEPNLVNNQKVNLQVTLDYSNTTEPDGWSNAVSKGVWIGHYSTDGTTAKDISSDGSSFDTGVKKVRVNSNQKTITFHVKDFSGVGVGTPGGSSGGNSNEDVAVRKTVEPYKVNGTIVENEFVVHMSIDTKETDIASIIGAGNWYAVTNNKAHDVALFGVTDIPQSDVVELTEVSSPGDMTTLYIIKNQAGNEVYRKYVKCDHSNNYTVYLKLPDGKYMNLGSSIKRGETEEHEVGLTSVAEEAMYEHASTSTTLNSVTDQMGASVIFLGSTGTVNGSISPDSEASSAGSTITWTPTAKTDVTPTTEQTTDSNGNIVTTKWYKNIAECSYRIRLDVKNSNFVNGGQEISQNGESALTENNYSGTVAQAKAAHLNAANDHATLTYNTDKTINFPVPYVRGTTYTFSFKKVDSENNTKTLKGAEFTLTDTSNPATVKTYTATSDENGVVTFTGVPWGDNWTLKETKAPDGYLITNSEVTLPHIGWSADSEANRTNHYSLQSDTQLKWLYLGKDKNGQDQYGAETANSSWTVENTPGVSLPGTGRGGIWPCVMSGLMLTVLAAAGLTAERKRTRHRSAYRHENRSKKRPNG